MLKNISSPSSREREPLNRMPSPRQMPWKVRIFQPMKCDHCMDIAEERFIDASSRTQGSILASHTGSMKKRERKLRRFIME
ncbi:hypothetical protein KP509_01G084900 [Ceratopteris richardii]|uniref:Uncharacterized protein n=1 Tax=Ceratopteris richardii TaxID=49495 RepID=A0A8T2VEU3_CERRI|nr:hypothetical protein KP509_01G084900 [Ceratopteris richardii]